MPREYMAELSREYSAFEDTQKRTIKLLRRMLIAKKLKKDVPNDKELTSKKQDFFTRVLPALNRKLDGKRFFVGDEQTMLDLVIFVELETVLLLLQENGNDTEESRRFEQYPNLA